MKENKRKIGDKFELIAMDFLRLNGYSIIEKNFTCKLGEIDIIAYDKSGDDVFLCFIEVKYRKNSNYGNSLEAVDIRKQKNIIKVSQYYLLRKGIANNVNIRYDVVGIDGDKVNIVKNAFGIDY